MKFLRVQLTNASFIFCFKFYSHWSLRIQFTISQHCFRLWIAAKQALNYGTVHWRLMALLGWALCTVYKMTTWYNPSVPVSEMFGILQADRCPVTVTSSWVGTAPHWCFPASRSRIKDSTSAVRRIRWDSDWSALSWQSIPEVIICCQPFINAIHQDTCTDTLIWFYSWFYCLYEEQ